MTSAPGEGDRGSPLQVLRLTLGRLQTLESGRPSRNDESLAGIIAAAEVIRGLNERIVSCRGSDSHSHAQEVESADRTN